MPPVEPDIQVKPQTGTPSVQPGKYRPPQKSRVARFSIFLRRTHMYVALFLTPWLTMYAISTLVFNHNDFFQNLYGGDLAKFDKVQDIPYTHRFDDDAEPRDIADQIQKDLKLPHKLGIRQPDEEGRYVFFEPGIDVFTPKRYLYSQEQQTVTVERQEFRTPNFLTRMHTRVGYGNKQTPARASKIAWAVAVDLSIFASILWVFSGFWMWWELKVTRSWGILFAFVGPLLFGITWWLG
jgi:hypothetical protein